MIIKILFVEKRIIFVLIVFLAHELESNSTLEDLKRFCSYRVNDQNFSEEFKKLLKKNLNK